MKKRILLPILLLATMSLGGSLVGCDKKGNNSNNSAQSQYSVAIDNKAALEGEWYEGETKDIDVTLSPEANPLVELNNKNLTVTSSDETVVKATGLGLSALKDGTATITVDYHGAKAEVNVTILSKSAIKKYGVAHEGTAEDPFTNEDAVAVASHKKYNNEVYYVKGEVAYFYNEPGERTDGAVAYFLKPAQPGGPMFEVYKTFKDKDTKLTDDDIWVGGVATAYGSFTMYGTQPETTSATFVSCEGTKPAARTTVAKPFADALSEGVALYDGQTAYNSYKVEGYISGKAGNNYYLTATKGETIVPGKSDAAHGEKDIAATNAIVLQDAGKVEALNAKLLEGAKVEVTGRIKNYHGTVEMMNLKDENVTVLEAGQAWAIPEPEVETKTLAEFIALENGAAKAYNVTAQIKAFKTNATKDKYGNMTLTDGTKDLAIYGASATATALAWDNASQYAFVNPQDFLTNTTSQALAVGNTITMKMYRADYTKDGKTTIQGTGIITNVVPVETTGIALDKETAEINVDATVTLTATRTPANSNTPAQWISEDETIATVEGGVVTGVKAGTVKITAKISETVKAECTVTVKAPEVVDIKWTSAELFGYNNADVGYGTVTEKTLNGITLGFTDMAAFKNQGGAIQFKKTSGLLQFKTAAPKRIAKLILEKYSDKAYSCKTYAAADVAGLASAAVATGTNEVYTFDAAANVHAIKIGGGTGASYLKSISIVYAE